MDNPVVKGPRYFNIFECDNNLFKKLHVTCERARVATSREKCHTKMYDTLIDYNYRNDASLPNENIQDAIHKGTEED